MAKRQVSGQRRVEVSNAAGMLRALWLRERTERPLALSLALIAGAMLALGAGLAATSSVLLGQLIAGIALLPLFVALYLHLLPAAPWTLAEDEPATEDHDPALPSGGTAAEVDWDRFERQFRAYAANHEPDQELASEPHTAERLFIRRSDEEGGGGSV